MTTRRFFLASLAALAALPRPASSAEKWPQRPVKIVVPFAAGGNTDGIARVMAQQLQQTFGETFVVENRPGGGGIVATEMVAKASPDGYTLMMAALPQIAILPAMRKPTYDPVADFAAISNVASNPFCLVVNPQFPARTLAELVTYVKARPGQVSYASGGSGSVSHLTMLLLCQKAQLDMTHVPYKGGGPAIADVIGNQTPIYFANLSEAIPYAGRELRAIALSGARRVVKLPDVPTIAESGYPDFRSETWNGFIAPARTPDAIVTLVAGAVQNALRDESVRRTLGNLGLDLIGSTPAEFKTRIAEDIAQWAAVIRAADLKL